MLARCGKIVRTVCRTEENWIFLLLVDLLQKYTSWPPSTTQCWFTSIIFIDCLVSVSAKLYLKWQAKLEYFTGFGFFGTPPSPQSVSSRKIVSCYFRSISQSPQTLCLLVLPETHFDQMLGSPLSWKSFKLQFSAFIHLSSDTVLTFSLAVSFAVSSSSTISIVSMNFFCLLPWTTLLNGFQLFHPYEHALLLSSGPRKP